MSDFLYLNDWGADATGVVDSTAAIQAAVDDVCVGGAVRRADRTLVVDGRYRISAPIQVRSVMGFEMVGTAGSALIATADMDSMLDLNGVAYSRFGGFELTGVGSATVQRAIHLYWDSATASRSTTLNRFHDIDIHALRYVTGIELGRSGDGNQVDNTTLRDVSIVGDWTAGEATLWQHGLVAGDGVYGNNLIHNAYGMASAHHRYNVDVRATQFGWFGGSCDGAEADLRVASTGYVRVEGIRSENSQRLLVTGGQAGWCAQVSLADIQWQAGDLHTDREVVIWQYGGVLALRQVALLNADTATPIFAMDAAAPSLLTIDGLTIDSTSGTPTPADVVSLGANARAVMRGYVTTNGQGIVQSISDYDSAAA